MVKARNPYGVCWACNRPGLNAKSLRKRGWRVRLTEVSGSVWVREMYCPACFAEWGWPPETIVEYTGEEQPYPVTTSRYANVCVSAE